MKVCQLSGILSTLRILDILRTLVTNFLVK